MRDKDSEWVAEMSGVGAIMAGAGADNTLLTSGDFRGLSMLRPTKLHKGILKMCLHIASPGGGKFHERHQQGIKEEASKEAINL